MRQSFSILCRKLALMEFKPQVRANRAHPVTTELFFLYFMSIVIIYNSYTVKNNILIKIDEVLYSFIVDITNSYKYFSRKIQNLNY